MKKVFLLLLAAGMGFGSEAQETPKQSKKDARKSRISAIAKQEEEGVIKYTKHTAFGIKLTTDGYGGFLEIGRAKSVKHALLFQLDISERKHRKEEKEQYPSQAYGNTSPIIYGKLNFFYPVKVGVQKQFLLGNKGNKNGVSISGNAGGGLIAGLLRPYMIQVVDNNSQPKFVNYDPSDTAQFFLRPERFIGGPNLNTGWNKLKVTPGIYAKAGVRFDYGKYNEMVNALEVGLSGEFYTKKIPQMIYNKEENFFFSGYVAIIFGKRK